MTDPKKHSRLSREILGLTVLSAGVALLLFFLLTRIASGTLETYCFNNDIPMTEYDWMEADRWIYGLGAVLAGGSFMVLFLFLLRDRVAYIRAITDGIDALRSPENRVSLALEGDNELTELAAAINGMSETRRQLREKEQALAREKEQLIRTLSHDIRTPLTAILSYSDYLSGQETMDPQERKAYLDMIRKKAEQIRDITAVLLDGSHRNPEFFADSRLLMEQIAAEFQEELEEDFSVITELSGCPAFSGTLDVQELRRIFDNLSSNVRKYASPEEPVTLGIWLEDDGLRIQQSNTIRRERPPAEGYQIGLHSIRRIAGNYGGSVTVEQKEEIFTVSILLRNL